MTYEQLKGVVSIASNTPGMPTGYGVQAKIVAERLKRHGVDVAAFSNYGLEGNKTTLATPYGDIPHYPRGFSLYSGDVFKPYHSDHLAGRNLPNFILTLYDVWVYLELKDVADIKFVSWTPLDHVTMPPRVEAWLRKENVLPIAMSPFGSKEMEQRKIDHSYIPHSVDTKVFKPTFEINGQEIRAHFGLKSDDFIVGMVSANKANGQIHRKAFAENLMAFSMFSKQHPNAYLYIHTEPSKVFGGFDLINLMRAVGLDKDRVLFPDPDKHRFGYSDQELAALYTGMDVMLHVSYGEGFGVPAIEAQACGTKVIASNWAASKDLVAEDGWLVQGQPFWDEGQAAFYNIPMIGSILESLNLSYKSDCGTSQTAIEFAQDFDNETVWNKYWMPFLKSQLK